MRARMHSLFTVIALLAVMGGQVAATAAPDLNLPFGDVDGGEVIEHTANLGTASTEQTVVTSGAGSAIARLSPLPGGRAMALPHFDGEQDGERAVLAVRPTDGAALNPTSSAFWFRADVRLHPVNSGTTSDNGNNVLQRGLFSGPQYKLQVDDGSVTCRMSGAESALAVQVEETLEAGTWYRLLCRRVVRTDGTDRLRLVIRPLADLADRTEQRSEIQSLGPLQFDQATPLSIGGKLRSNLTIPNASDQFNGRIDNVRVVVR